MAEDYRAAIERYQDDEGIVSGREGLRRYREEGGRIRSFDWQRAWQERQDFYAEGVDPEYTPDYGERAELGPEFSRRTSPGRSRYIYWTRLYIQEPDGSIRDDQYYDFDDYQRLTDRQAVVKAVTYWNGMMRMAPSTGSLTGYAIGGQLVDVRYEVYNG